MGVDQLGQKLAIAPLLIPALILSMTLHELAHGLVATKLGDPTPRSQGRLTLNPIKHLDPIGSLVFLITFLFMPFPFGWARPVQVRPDTFASPKRGMAAVAVAGPLTNFLIALVVLAGMVHLGAGVSGTASSGWWSMLILYVFQVNIVLGVFNLLPVPPLDGSRIIAVFMPDHVHEEWTKLDAYAPLFILLLLFVFGQQTSLILQSGASVVVDAMLVVVGA